MIKKYSAFLVILALCFDIRAISDTNELYQEDISACFKLINFSVNSTQEEIDAKRSSIEDYIKLVATYPADKKKYLKKATVNYIYYILSSLYDVNTYYTYYVVDAPKQYMTKISDRTKKFKAEIEIHSASKDKWKNYQKRVEIDINKLPKDKTYLELPEDKQIEIMTTMAILDDVTIGYQQRTARTYQTIFRERFPRPEWATLEWLP